MSLNGLYDHMIWNKGKTEHLALVAKSQGASDYENICYDLAKWLSHYLYFFSFFFSFGLTTQERM